jgi:deoxyadenosine/deoxycytidine kinase
VQQAPPFIVVAGNIGAGKSTVVQLLSERLGFAAWLEGVESNPFFADFYADPARWAFHSQVAFITGALVDHLRISRSREGAVQDRGVHEMYEIFAGHHRAEGNISDREMAQLGRLVEVADLVRAPDLLVYVCAPLDELVRRVRSRARPAERAVSLGYLRELQQRYEPFLAQWRLSPILRVNTSLFDPRGEAGADVIVAETQAALRNAAMPA